MAKPKLAPVKTKAKAKAVKKVAKKVAKAIVKEERVYQSSGKPIVPLTKQQFDSLNFYDSEEYAEALGDRFLPTHEESRKAALKQTAKVAVQTALASLPKGTFETAGTMLGSVFGPAGAGLGAMGGKALARLTGYGDYQLEVNSLMKPGSAKSQLQTPTFARGGTSHSVRVSKREFVGMITTSATAGQFNVQRYRVNAGSPSLFPFLATTLSLGYEQWRPLGLVFHLKTVASDYAAGATLGTMGMAMDYQSEDAPYATRQELEESMGAVSGKISFDILMGVECNPKYRPTELLFMRNGPVPTGDSINLYDLGILEVFTVGCTTASAQVAELWATYDFELVTQQLRAGPNGLGACVAGLLPLSSAVTTTNFFGADASSTRQGGFWIGQNSGQILVLPDWLSGIFWIRWAIDFTANGNYGMNGVYSYAGNVHTAVTKSANTDLCNQLKFTNDTVCILGDTPQLEVTDVIVVLPASTPGGNTITLSGGGSVFGTVNYCSFVVVQLPASAGNPVSNWTPVCTTMTGDAWQ